MKLYLIRHAQAESNVEKKVNDSLRRKINLTKLGKKQSEYAAKKLKNIKLQAIFSSQFPRSLQTAKIIDKYHNSKIIKDKRLNEWASGFDGKSYDELNNYLKTDTFLLKHKKGESIPKLKKELFLLLMN